MEKGKISVMVKGALKAKNKYGNSLLLMSISNVTIYWKENRELQIMSDSESKFKLNNISNSLEKIASGLAIIELLNAFVPIEDPNIDIYNLTVNSLKTLNDSNINESILRLGYTIKLFSKSGYKFNVSNCGVCNNLINSLGGKVAFSIALCSPLCANCRDKNTYRAIDYSVLEIINNFLENEDKVDSSINLNDISQLEEIINILVKHHVDGIRKLKVSQIASKL